MDVRQSAREALHSRANGLVNIRAKIHQETTKFTKIKLDSFEALARGFRCSMEISSNHIRSYYVSFRAGLRVVRHYRTPEGTPHYRIQ